ncbi:MAG: Uracil DNA glycosylase superfamily protein [Deltaproteobacteria bacterium ADurb.Bin510]|nr:MAG: Uracil DNA glycosylase superfamily protein [Deltaproteobacteria bacterium ADurb.Bin510]
MNLKALLHEERAWGGDYVLLPAGLRPAASPPARAAARPVIAPEPAIPGETPGEAIKRISGRLGECRLCGLAAGRPLCGEGDPTARILFVTGAPGAPGSYFQGEADQLFGRIIENVFKLNRHEIYLTGAVKCCGEPDRQQTITCQAYLQQQIMAIRPEVIVALGKLAAQSLLGSTEPISRLRGQWGQFMGVPVMPTFHPDFLVVSPSKKRETWEDLKQVVARLGSSC